MNKLSYDEKIERKYKKIAKIPEGLFRFTIPIRIKAVSLLGLTAGSAVLDVGCGTGPSFPYLENLVGEGGRIMGVEPSRSMISAAQERVRLAGWENITLRECTIEAFEDGETYDGALLFAMQDVFNSTEGLRVILSHLKPGGKIVCVGPKLQEKGFTRIFNPMLKVLFRRMALSQENLDQPWRTVEKIFPREVLLKEKRGLIFIYLGRKA